MLESASKEDVGSESSGILPKLLIIFWERRWLVIIPTILLGAAGIIASLVLPPTYQSRAVLLVESQDLPDQQANARQPVSEIDRRMAKIREQILSRPDLVALIQAHNLYDASSRAQPLSVLVEKMRADTNISAVDADISQGGPNRPGSASIAFSLTFDYPRPALAQLVAQTFVDRLLRLDASESESEALNNVRFLEDQESTLQQKLSGIEGEINRITGMNGAALSAGSSFGTINMGGNYEGQIAALERENAQLRAQTGGSAVERDPAVTAAETQLAAARAQYSDDHPDVKLAESRLAAARQAASSYQSRAVSGTIAAQIAANNSAIAQLNRSRSIDQARAATLAAAQARGPAVAQQVSQLQAQADVVRTNLGKVTSSLLSARSMAKLADEQRGERLTLIEPPARPDQPTSPNRRLLIAGGLIGGLLAGLALALLVEIVIRPIRHMSELTRLLGEPPLVVIPVLSKKRFRPKRKDFFARRKSFGQG